MTAERTGPAPRLDPADGGICFIQTWEMPAEAQVDGWLATMHDRIHVLTSRPGFRSMSLHRGLDGTHAAVYAHTIAIGIAFSLITYMHVILGELVPKTLALQRAEQVALAVAAPMEAFLTLTRPVLFFMRRSGGLVLRLFGAQMTRRGGAIHSPDELKLIVTASRQFGQIPEFQEEMIHSAIELDSITVREVMVARPDIF